MKKSPSCDLQSCFMCRHVIEQWKLAIGSHRRNFVVKKGEAFIREGEPVNGIYFVRGGKVKVHKTWGDKELIIRFASNGAIIGHRGLSTTNTVFPISATALEYSLLCFISLDFFLATLKANPEFTFKLMMFYADELQESERRMRNLAHMSVKGRLANSLMHMEELFGTTEQGHIDIELSRQDIAAFTGTTYETVFRTLAEMVKENLISITGKWITIADYKNLKALAE